MNEKLRIIEKYQVLRVARFADASSSMLIGLAFGMVLGEHYGQNFYLIAVAVLCMLGGTALWIWQKKLDRQLEDK